MQEILKNQKSDNIATTIVWLPMFSGDDDGRAAVRAAEYDDHRLEPEHVVKRVNELLSRPGILRQLLMPEAYVEQQGQWRLNLVDVDGSYQLRLL